MLLRSKLGPVRAWPETLTDMRRNKTDYLGLTLKPYCRVRDQRGSPRPYYRLRDVADFIEAARAIAPPMAARSYMVDVDAGDRRIWTQRVFDRSELHVGP
ncbi:hypothetical protein [Paraburkholderia dipogonis]|uniref:hypothetical protein n=1 Tax=Paraburkholderia dipogonis TaxID=1211383 RepID=UPI0038B713B8